MTSRSKAKLVAPHDVTCEICGVTYKTMRPDENAHPQCVRRIARLERDKLCAEYAEKHFGALCPQLTEEAIYDALERALKLVNHKENEI